MAIDPELDEQLTSVAETLDRPRSWVAEQAIKEFVDLQAWHLTAIDEGIKAADAGKLVPDEDVAAWVESWGTRDELPIPECK
ncbi:MAG TPA: CopG family ribbon-helix-helix protein [Stellaceae bacterium]|nr:CopG family ribbon-helix-helix protein [Stellaceae bacterium]